MPGLLLNTVAEVVRQILIDAGHGVDPAVKQDWPIFVHNEPDRPDRALTLYDTTGLLHWQLMNGEVEEDHGVQLRVRAATTKEAWLKAREIAVAFDKDILKAIATVDGNDYCVHSILRTGDVIPIGKDVPRSERSIVTLNLLVYVTPL